MPWGRRCSDVSQVRCRNDFGEEDEIKVEDRSSSLTENSAVLRASERASVETLSLLLNDVAGEELRQFLGCNSKWE